MGSLEALCQVWNGSAELVRYEKNLGGWTVVAPLTASGQASLTARGNKLSLVSVILHTKYGAPAGRR